MTYLELYRSLASVDEIKKKAFDDTKVALFLGGNPDRIRAIEDAMNEAIREMEVNRNETD